MPTSESAEVLIVGGGPVGLSVALELARFGIRSIVIEKNASVATHPKARNFATRTMEISKGWGRFAYKRLQSIDLPEAWKHKMWFLETVTGKAFGSIDMGAFLSPGLDISAASPIVSSQERLEQVLLDAARATGIVDVRFNHEVVRLIRGSEPEAKDASIEVMDRRDGSKKVLTATVLVGADGASSFVRNAIGVQVEGEQGYMHLINCYFRADIEPHVGDRKGAMLYVARGEMNGVFQPLDAAGRWLCQIQTSPENWTLDYFGPERATDWIRYTTGVEDLEIEFISMGKWKLSATVAEKFVAGRILLCGDAAHQFPPTGGLGVNTGIQGAHNAMWKVASFLKGKSNWALVETYQTERRGFAREVADQSLENARNVGRITAASIAGASSDVSVDDAIAATRRYGNHFGVEFGYQYASPAIIRDGSSPPAVTDPFSDYAPSATPGCRAPHFWLGRSSERFSNHDLLGSGFLLLSGAGGAAWAEAAKLVGADDGLQVDCYRIGAPGLADTEDRFLGLYELNADGAVLIRPDGYVAWRSQAGPSSPDILKDVMHSLNFVAR